MNLKTKIESNLGGKLPAFLEEVGIALNQFLEEAETVWAEFLKANPEGFKEDTQYPKIDEIYRKYTKKWSIHPLDDYFQKAFNNAATDNFNWVYRFLEVILHGPNESEELKRFGWVSKGLRILYVTEAETDWSEFLEESDGVIITQKVNRVTRTLSFKPTLLSRNQQTLVATLTKHLRVFEASMQLGGFCPRPPLVISPSGSGKNTSVKALAQIHGLPIIILEPSNWILNGAKAEPYTTNLIRDFVKSNPTGIIAIDECDKFGNHNAQDWWKSVQREAMAFIERKKDFMLRTWDIHDIEKFEKNFFMIGMGTWQSLFRSATPDSEIDFSTLVGSNKIPEELLARFTNPILLEAPNQADFIEGISRIHRQLSKKLQPEEIEALAQKAIDSEKNMRWLEDYAMEQMLLSVPEEKIPRKVGYPKELEENVETREPELDPIYAQTQKLWQEKRTPSEELEKAIAEKTPPEKPAESAVQPSYIENIRQETPKIKEILTWLKTILDQQCKCETIKVSPIRDSRNLKAEDYYEFVEKTPANQWLAGNPTENLTLEVSFPDWNKVFEPIFAHLDPVQDGPFWDKFQARIILSPPAPENFPTAVAHYLWENHRKEEPMDFLNKTLRFSNRVLQIGTNPFLECPIMPTNTPWSKLGNTLKAIKDNAPTNRLPNDGIDQLLRPCIHTTLGKIIPPTLKVLDMMEELAARINAGSIEFTPDPRLKAASAYKAPARWLTDTLNQLGIYGKANRFSYWLKDGDDIQWSSHSIPYFAPEILGCRVRDIHQQIQEDNWENVPGELHLIECCGTQSLLTKFQEFGILDKKLPSFELEALRRLIETRGDIILEENKPAWETLLGECKQEFLGHPEIEASPLSKDHEKDESGKPVRTSASIDNPKETKELWENWNEAVKNLQG